MKITKFLIIVSFLILSFDHAQAEEKSRSSMRYTTMGSKQENVNLKSIEYSNEDPKKAERTEKQEVTADKTWERYKALAAGKSEPKGEPAKEAEQIEEPKAAEPQPASTQLTGLAGLIQQYQENKEKRGGMRSMTIGQPGAIKQKNFGKSKQQPQTPAP